jgi:hypothetical protein
MWNELENLVLIVGLHAYIYLDRNLEIQMGNLE